MSQTGMSFVQQGLVVLGTFLAISLHLTLTELGFITSALSLGVMASMVFAGMAVDRFGPRIILFWGALLMSLFAALLRWAHGYEVLLVVLFLVGVGLAIVPSAGTKAVFTAFAGRPRGLVMGIRQTGVPLGAALAAWLLPALAPRWGLDPLYVVFAVELLVLGWALAVVILPRARSQDRAAPPGLQRQHLGRLWRPVTIAFLMVSGQYILLTYTISYLHRTQEMSLAVAGLVLAVGQVGGGTGRILLGQLSDRLGGKRAPVIGGAAVLGALVAVVAGFLPVGTPVGMVMVVWFFFGAGVVGWNALCLTWAGESVPSEHSGFAMSFTGTVVFLGSAIFPPLFGHIVDATHHYRVGWELLAVVLGIAALLSFWATQVGRAGGTLEEAESA